ncbi:type I-F CRISPR-associated protein Csy1 [uncultured Thiothrix sp.]|uniref:type I-F CRISPR-associated protein Csy1 n=1 Tax=uncultured Thiothrix sp. TaxID=223185 RepID=UPI002637D4D1|nr:type I-F CRISPR-associated protein Csy1 [uncultured Thiothrix sp.]
MSNPISDFLDGRKQKPLKEGKKPAAEIETDYSIPVWVANAANRASQLSLVSHPAKFSHPDAKTTPVLFTGEFKPDGYLRSGNVAINQQDVVGNAAALDVYAFLSLVLADGSSVLTHFDQQSDLLKGLLKTDEETFQLWRKQFLAIKQSTSQNKTYAQVKQVYFPVEQGYELLSILYPSGLMTEHRERLRTLKFSENTKQAREARKKNEFHEQGFDEVFGLLTQHFGGTKPQNISKLNSNNGGEAWLLPCLPPTLQAQYVALPKIDFFKAIHWDKQLTVLLKALHGFLGTNYNNVDIRDGRKRIMTYLFEWLLERAARLQTQKAGWSQAQGFELPEEQQLWLDPFFYERREAEKDWREKIAARSAKWLMTAYERSRKTKQDAEQLGVTEAKAFENEWLDYMREYQEFL